MKTVCLTGTGVRIPQPAPKNTNFSVGVFLFFVLNLCAVTMGEERKTVDNCFSRTKSIKQREMKQGYALSTFRLCDLTGHVELKTVCPKGTGVRIPLPAPIKMVYSLRVDLFLLPQSEARESALRANSRGEGFAFEP